MTEITTLPDSGTFPLTAEQREILRQIAEHGQPLQQRRAQVILLYAAGQATGDVSRGAGLSVSRARYWRRQFQLRGMAIFPNTAPPPAAALPVDPPPARQKRKPRRPSRKEKLRIAAQERLAQATALPLLQPVSKAGILASDEFAEAGRKILAHQFAEMLRHEAGTRSGEDIEDLHDMRVATRRMRAAMEIFLPAFESDAIQPFLKGLRAAGRALGRARDWDVFLDKTRSDFASAAEDKRAGLEPMIEAWEAERGLARQTLVEHLNSEKFELFKIFFNEFLQSPGAGVAPLPPERPIARRVRDVAPAIIYSRLEVVRSYETLLPTANIEQLHALRIDVKRLRYAVEFFRETLGREASEVITVLKALQDHLGDLHDADVACAMIRQFMDDWEARQVSLPLSERQSAEHIAAYLSSRHADRHRLLVTFPQAWDQFNQPDFRRALALSIAVL